MLNNEKVIGNIAKKSIEIDPQRKAFLVSALFKNQDIVFVGNTIDIMVETGKATNSIWIQTNSFRKLGKKNYVFISKEGKAVRKDITIGNRNEENVQVLNGLNNGDVLVISGIDKLSNDTEVTTSQQNN